MHPARELNPSTKPCDDFVVSFNLETLFALLSVAREPIGKSKLRRLHRPPIMNTRLVQPIRAR